MATSVVGSGRTDGGLVVARVPLFFPLTESSITDLSFSE
jgi:hypothetical protein